MKNLVMREEPVGAAAKLETARNMEQMDQSFCPIVHFFTSAVASSAIQAAVAFLSWQDLLTLDPPGQEACLGSAP